MLRNNSRCIGSRQKKLVEFKREVSEYIKISYIEKKLLQDDYYHFDSVKKICAGCGKEFWTNLINVSFALRVEKNIQFCNTCYTKIIYHGDRNVILSQSKNEMLVNLSELIRAIDIIPAQKFMEVIPLPAFPIKRQINIGRLLLKTPSYRVYKERFGTWIESMIQAGVIEDCFATPRGIQCIAEDGHLCFSLGEKTIDDWLYNRSILHTKETNYPFDAKLNPRERLRCDWKVGEVYIEYAGMMQEPDYFENMEKKVKLAEKLNLHLIIIEPDELMMLENKLSLLYTSSIK